MKKAIPVIIILLFSFNLIFGQGVKVLDGFIDKYPIQMFLNCDSSEVVGYYFYKKYGKPIYISGEFVGKQLKLKELYDIKGTWESEPGGVFVLNEYYSGNWESNNKVFNVNLKETNSDIKWEIFNQKVELAHTFNNGKKHKYPIQISIKVPYYKENKELVNLIIPEILGVKKESYSSIWNYFNKYTVNKYTEYLNGDFSDKYPQYFEVDISGIVVSISDSILNYKTSGYIYQGGAHGYGFENYFIFDLTNMTRLKFNDIFKSDAKPGIAKLLFKKDNQEHKLKDFERSIGNIYLTSKGVGFFFNPYQIDCYACGTFNYFLDFSELQEFLKE
ncbi:MAG: RsiV family protein [Bacteroidales bacterium]|nr:RsiV family protein [Bacteroidales bacterium]